jgi:PAB1-binding protein PBP1
MESPVTDNVHIKEERGLIEQKDGDEDEEMKYSSVIRIGK